MQSFWLLGLLCRRNTQYEKQSWQTEKDKRLQTTNKFIPHWPEYTGNRNIKLNIAVATKLPKINKANVDKLTGFDTLHVARQHGVCIASSYPRLLIMTASHTYLSIKKTGQNWQKKTPLNLIPWIRILQTEVTPTSSDVTSHTCRTRRSDWSRDPFRRLITLFMRRGTNQFPFLYDWIRSNGQDLLWWLENVPCGFSAVMVLSDCAGVRSFYS